MWHDASCSHAFLKALPWRRRPTPKKENGPVASQTGYGRSRIRRAPHSWRRFFEKPGPANGTSLSRTSAHHWALPQCHVRSTNQSLGLLPALSPPCGGLVKSDAPRIWPSRDLLRLFYKPPHISDAHNETGKRTPSCSFFFHFRSIHYTTVD